MEAAAGHGPAPQSSGADTRVGASLARPTAKCRQKVCLTGGGSPHPRQECLCYEIVRLTFGGPQVANAIVHSEAI